MTKLLSLFIPAAWLCFCIQLAPAQQSGGGWGAEWTERMGPYEAVSVIYREKIRTALARKKYDVALVETKKWQAAQPGNSEPLFAKSIIFHKCRNYTGSAAADGEALQLKDLKTEIWAYLLSHRSEMYSKLKNYPLALADLQARIPLDKTATGHNDLAWMLATCRDPKIRNGKDAVSQATLAVKLSGGRQSACLDTLAAAYAEVGDFPQAVNWEKKALVLCQDSKKKREITQRLHLYEQQQPFRDIGDEN